MNVRYLRGWEERLRLESEEPSVASLEARLYLQMMKKDFGAEVKDPPKSSLA